MTTYREVMQQALDALESIVKEMRVTPAVQGREYVGLGIQANNAIAALRAALAEQPAPVLTDEQIIAIRKKTRATNCDPWGDTLALGRAILAAAIPPGCVVVPVSEIESLKKTGPIMQRGELGDRSPWMGTMLDVLEDYKLAASVEADERRRLSAEVEALLRNQRCAGLEGDETGSPCNTYKMLEARHAAEVESLRKAVQWSINVLEAGDPEGTVLGVLQAALAARPGECQHKWVNADNAHVEGADLCMNCGAIRARPGEKA